jgi:hypothetical protein
MNIREGLDYFTQVMTPKQQALSAYMKACGWNGSRDEVISAASLIADALAIVSPDESKARHQASCLWQDYQATAEGVQS